MADGRDRRDPHDAHDLGLVVAFVDGELDARDHALAEAQVEGCAGCARLALDLRALAAADRALPTPARRVDFRLTAADAARLRTGPAEPVAAGPRPGSMPTEHLTRRTVSPVHPSHDPTLIAAAVDGALTDDERRRADEWLATCSACADLHADLILLAEANRAMATPARPRDLRLSERDAARLRVGGWRRLLARVGGARDTLSRPLAAGLTTLGLAGLLITGGPSVFGTLGGATAGAPNAAPAAAASDAKAGGIERESDNGAFTGAGDSSGQNSERPALPIASAAASAAPSATTQVTVTSGVDPSASVAIGAPDTPSYAPGIQGSDGPDSATSGMAYSAAPSDPRAVAALPADSGRDSGSSFGLERLASTSTGAEPPSIALILSLLALVAGLGLFVVRWSAGRVRGI